MNISDYLWGSEKTWIARHNGLLLGILTISVISILFVEVAIYKGHQIHEGNAVVPNYDCVKNNGTNVMFVRFSLMQGEVDCVRTADYFVAHGWSVQRYGINDEDWIVLEKK